jgi:antitoxin (DNA-binding transcriptional repressor) of toxin-antitoxin stability system
MITMNVVDIQTQLPKLLEFVSEGNEVVIADGNKPIAKIVPFLQTSKKRTAGLNKGMIRTSEDFDDPLPENFWNSSI